MTGFGPSNLGQFGPNDHYNNDRILSSHSHLARVKISFVQILGYYTHVSPSLQFFGCSEQDDTFLARFNP